MIRTNDAFCGLNAEKSLESDAQKTFTAVPNAKSTSAIILTQVQNSAFDARIP